MPSPDLASAPTSVTSAAADLDPWMVGLAPEALLTSPQDPWLVVGVIAAVTFTMLGLIFTVSFALRYRAMFMEMRDLESRQRAVLDTAVDGIVLIDGDGTIQSFNPVAEALFGWTAQDIVGRNVSLLMPEEARSAHHGQPHLLLTSPENPLMGFDKGRQVQGRRKDGSLFPLRLAIGRVQQPGPALFVGFITDLTQQQRLEHERECGQQQLHSLVSNLPGVAFRCENSPQRPVLFISEAVQTLTGWSAEDFLQRRVDFFRLISAEDTRRIALDVEYAVSQHQPYHVEYHLSTRDGQMRCVSEHGRVVFDKDAPQGWIDGVILDITDSKAQSAEFEGMIAAINRSQAAAEFNLQGCLINANANFLTLTGYTLDEVLGRPHQFFCTPECAKSAEYVQFWQRLREGAFRAAESQRVGKQGRLIWLHETYNPMRDAMGRVYKIIAFATDLSERRIMEQDLREAKEHAEAAAAARAAFLANMSHEIRTPMNAIIGFTEVLLDTPLTPSQAKQLHTVRHSARSLLRLLNDILDTAKLEKGAVALEIEPFDLRALCEQILASLKIHADKKHLSLTLDYDPCTPQYWRGDAFRIQQILLNLLGNAIKFTHEGAVQLQIGGRSEALQITVQDSGIGMNEEQLARIFAPFSQADVSTSRRYGGTGLGTSIALQLTQLMGGHLTVDSHLGRGSSFKLYLPLSCAQANSVAVAQAHAAAATLLMPLRILGVDDVQANLELLEIVAQRAGHHLETALSGEQALALLGTTAERFDVVLMDLQMPDLDGLQVTRLLRQREQAQHLPRTPVIALSASVLAQDRSSALEAGMDGFADKPLDPPRLWAEVARVLGHKASPQPPAQQQEPARAVVPTVDVIDWERALRLWGQEATLRTALERFAQDSVGFTALHRAVQAQDGAALKSAAHRLHGAAANLALSDIQACARRLEHASSQPDAARDWPDLLSDLARARQALQSQLERGAQVGTEPAAPLPSPPAAAEPSLSRTQRDQLLTQIDALCAMLATGELPPEPLAALEQSLTPAQLHPTHEALDSFDFSAAEQHLKDLRRHLVEESEESEESFALSTAP